MSGSALRKLRLGLTAFLAVAVFGEAAYLRNIPVHVAQPDGTILSCLASGDEFYNWLHDRDDYTIVRDAATGFLVYAAKAEGRLVPSTFIAGRTDPRTLEQAGIRPRLADDERISVRRNAKALGEPVVNVPQTGTINNIVVYIRFADQAEFAGTYVGNVAALFNSGTPGVSSFRNYFAEASYGQLSIGSTFYPGSTPGVFSYQDANPRAYYMPYDAATNPAGYPDETERRIREHALLRNAIGAVSAEIPAGLTIDADADGYVDNICFVVKGEPTAWSTLLWPHKWALYTAPYSYINGKLVWTYNFQLETSLSVSVLCHEMFHSLGAPDLYHYNSSSSSLHPAWTWDLMDYNLDPPQHMGAYMKWKYGKWIASIPLIASSGTYVLNPLSSSTNNSFRIPSPFSPTEFFVVEYRKRTGGGTFEGNLRNEGLLVYRINPAYNGNADGPPDEVYIYRPNGTPTVEGDPRNAPLSADQSRTQINDGTNPSSFLTGGLPGGLSISNVGSLGGTLSFSVTLETIRVTSPNGGETWNAGETKTVTWASSGAIGSVDIELSTDGGSEWTTLLDNTPNDGTAQVSVPAVSGSSCLIKVAEGVGGAIFDVSDAVFSILMIADSVTVTSPNGGEAWRAGSTHSITWTWTGTIDNVAIEYSVDGGGHWLPAAASVTNTGSWPWKVPGSLSASCLIRISEAGNAAIFDTSGGLFAIISAVRADFNGDGREDILWRYYGGGALQGSNRVWYMDPGGSPGPAEAGFGPAAPGARTRPDKRGPKRTYATPYEAFLPRDLKPARSHLSPWEIGSAAVPKPDQAVRRVMENPRSLIARNERRVMARKSPGRPGWTVPRISGPAGPAAIGPLDLAAGEEHELPSVLDTAWEIVGTGDFNGDSHFDILWRYNGPGGYNLIWYMEGTVPIGLVSVDAVTDLNWHIVGTGDFDNDGGVDILWRYEGPGGYNLVWDMDGAVPVGLSAVDAVADLNWRIVGTGDFNADGQDDILWRYAGPGGYNLVWYMNGPVPVGLAGFDSVNDLNWQIAGTGEFNGDEKIDILWRYGAAGGYNLVWYMDGMIPTGLEALAPMPDPNWRIVGR